MYYHVEITTEPKPGERDLTHLFCLDEARLRAEIVNPYNENREIAIPSRSRWFDPQYIKVLKIVRTEELIGVWRDKLNAEMARVARMGGPVGNSVLDYHVFRKEPDIAAQFLSHMPPGLTTPPVASQSPGVRVSPVASPASPLTLAGHQKRRLQQALMDAFPDATALEQMVNYGLDENLITLAGSGDLKAMTFNLIKWAEAHGRLADLIKAARDDNPSNPKLNEFIQSIHLN